MQVELGTLSPFHFEASQADLVHNLSPVDVNHALGLAQYGYQQLRPISKSGRTFFNIPLRFDDHTAKVVIQVSTVLHPELGYSKNDVVGAYQPCCDSHNQRIRSDIASVYDSYIRANRQTFDDSCLERLHSQTNCLSDRGLCLSPPKLLSGQTRNQCHQPTSQEEPLSPKTQEIPRSDEIDHGDDNDRESSSSNNSSVVGLPSEKETEKKAEDPEETTKNAELARLLVRQVTVGMKKMEKRKKAFDPWTIDVSYILEQFEQIRALNEKVVKKTKDIQAKNLHRHQGAPEDVEDLANLFEELENKGETCPREAQMRKWWFWYFKSCLLIISYRLRQVDKDRKASGAYVMHLIVNELLATEGISALTVIAALAEQSHELTHITLVSSERQVKVSTAVAKSLRGKLKSPPQNYLIPVVIDWVGAVTNLSHREVYNHLGCPNLAPLQLDKDGEPDHSLQFSREYSFLCDRWAPFASTQEELSQTIQSRGPELWEKAPETEKFAMVVEEWWKSQPLSSNCPDTPFSMEASPEASERTRNSAEGSENDELSSLTDLSGTTEASVNINTSVQGATMTPDSDMRRGDETDKIDEILAAATLQRMQHPSTISVVSQNSFMGHSPESASQRSAQENFSQRITPGSESPSQVMDSGGLGAFGASWISQTGSFGQAQCQSDSTQLHRYVPDYTSNHTGPPRKRICLGQPIDTDTAAMPTQNYEDQTAIPDNLTSMAGQGHLHSSQRRGFAPFANTISVPESMTSFTEIEALGQGTTPAMAAHAWNWVEDNTEGSWNPWNWVEQNTDGNFNSEFINFIDSPLALTNNMGCQP